MNYPQHLLPQSNYRKIEYNDELNKCSLVRHTNTQDIFMVGTKDIDADVILFQSDHLRDLSTNLLGIFKIEDVYIEILNKDFINDWESGQTILVPQFTQDFTINRDRSYFVLNIDDILGLNSSEQLTEKELTIKILHTPTKSNFWHFSIRVYKNNTEVSLLEINDKQKSKLWRTIRVLMSDLAYYIEEETCSLPEKHYLCN